jgi:hypothetical protein
MVSVNIFPRLSFLKMSSLSCSDFSEFVSVVAKQAASSVDRVPQVHTSALSEGSLERMEYRRTKAGSRADGYDPIEPFLVKIHSNSGEKASIESHTNMVRLSVKLAYEGPDACILTKKIQDKFFTRLARTIPHFLRKKPLPGFDISLIFTGHDVGKDVEAMLLNFLPVCRQVCKLVRLNQIIENQRAGTNVFSKLAQVLPKKLPGSQPERCIQRCTDTVQLMEFESCSERGSEPDLNVDADLVKDNEVFLI